LGLGFVLYVMGLEF